MTVKHPSQHRQALDYIYAELGEKPRTIRQVIDASQMPEAATGQMLQLGIRAGMTVAHDGGYYTFTRSNVKRTAFRDGIVRQWFKENSPCTNVDAIKAFRGFMSKSQLYYSVARLSSELTSSSDGSRVPVYSFNETVAE